MKLNLESRLKDGFSFVKKRINYALLPLTLLAGMYQIADGRTNGDINDDGQVNVLDIQKAVGETLGTIDFDYKSDVNRDGRIDVLDIQNKIQTALGNRAPEQVYDFSGRVVDLETVSDANPTGTGLASATVSLKDFATGIEIMTFPVKNINGDFLLYNIPQGLYRPVLRNQDFIPHMDSPFNFITSLTKDYALVNEYWGPFLSQVTRPLAVMNKINISQFQGVIIYTGVLPWATQSLRPEQVSHIEQIIPELAKFLQVPSLNVEYISSGLDFSNSLNNLPPYKLIYCGDNTMGGGAADIDVDGNHNITRMLARLNPTSSTTPETALEEGIGATGTDDSNLITPAIVNDSPILNNIAGVLQFADYMVSKYMYHPVYGRKAGSINPDTNQ